MLIRPFFLFVVISAAALAQSVITADQTGSNAERWTDLFFRSEGWLGADGIYSIPLDGNDNWGSASKQGKTLFVFSDTILGNADPETKKYQGYKMVNHSAAVLTSDGTETRQTEVIQFIHGTNGDGSRTNIFEKKYWLQDGIVINKKLCLTGFLPGQDWKPTHIDLLTIPLLPSDLPDWQKVVVSERVPLIAKNEQFLVMFGNGLLDHTSTDGFVYVYGYRDNLRTNVKHLVAARVKPESFADVDQWRFWSGSDWEKNCSAAFRNEAALADRISTELSVTPIGQGQFLLIFVQDVISGKVAYKVGSSPIGPFGKTVVFYETPEPKTLGKGIYVYNAKAHPHLSAPDRLLISYNVNRFASLPHTVDEYRPRFIELPMEMVRHPENL